MCSRRIQRAKSLYRLGNFVQGVTPVDHSRDLASFDELAQGFQISLSELGEEGVELLVEAGESWLSTRPSDTLASVRMAATTPGPCSAGI